MRLVRGRRSALDHRTVSSQALRTLVSARDVRSADSHSIGDMLAQLTVEGQTTSCPSPLCASAVQRILPPGVKSDEQPRSPTSSNSAPRRFSDAVKQTTNGTNGHRRDSQESAGSPSSTASLPRATDALFSPTLSVGTNGTSPAQSIARLSPLLNGVAAAVTPSGQSISFPSTCPYAVLRLDNLPWTATVDNVRDFLSFGSRPIENVLPPPQQHALSVHILCDRVDGRTADSAYVEVVDDACARRLARELKGQRILNRVVGIHLSSQQELMAAVRREAERILTHAALPVEHLRGLAEQHGHRSGHRRRLCSGDAGNPRALQARERSRSEVLRARAYVPATVD